VSLAHPLKTPPKVLPIRFLGAVSIGDKLGKSPSWCGDELVESNGGSKTGPEVWGETPLSSPKSPRFSTGRFTSERLPNPYGQRTYIRLSSVVHTVHMTDYDEEDVFNES
jgi:hypothetical protein